MSYEIVTCDCFFLGCGRCNIELAYLVDSSTKTDQDAWTQMLNYVSSSVQGYTIRSDCVRAAVIRYGNSADAPIQLNSYSNADDLAVAIGRIEFLGGGSNLAAALDLLRSQVFASNMVRSNAVKIAIVITDQLQSSSQITTAANSVKSDDITIVGVAITAPGRSVDTSFFGTLVSSRDCLIQVSNYDRLVREARGRVVTDCACLEYVAPPTTTTPAAPAPSPSPRMYTLHSPCIQQFRRLGLYFTS